MRLLLEGPGRTKRSEMYQAGRFLLGTVVWLPGHVYRPFRPYQWQHGVITRLPFPCRLMSCNAYTWKGFGASQGVFREYYIKTPPFEGNQLVSSIGLLIVVCTGVILQYIRQLHTDLFEGYPTNRVTFPTSVHRIPPTKSAVHDVGWNGARRWFNCGGCLLAKRQSPTTLTLFWLIISRRPFKL